jgi:excisionase family DNA binding protein
MRVRFVRAMRSAGSGETPPRVGDGASPACPLRAPPYQPYPAAPNVSTSPAPPFLSLRAAAEWLCVSLSTLKRLVARGEFIAVRVGKRRKIPAGSLAAYVSKDLLIPGDETELNESIS